MKRLIAILAFASVCVFCFAQSLGNYTFSHGVSSYTPISSGTQLGNESTSGQRFVDPAIPLGGTATTGPGFPIGFNFYFNGQEYDRVGICASGWISLGQSWEVTALNMSANTTTPLGYTSAINPSWLVSRIAGLANNMSAQAGSSLRIETIGILPYRVLVVQWNNY